MGFLDALFGGSKSKSKSTSKSSSKPVDLTPKPFKDLQQPFADVLKDAFGNASDLVNTNFAGSGGSFGGGGSSGTWEQATTETPEAAQIRTQGLLPAALQDPNGAKSYTQDVIAGKYLPGQEGANPFYNAAFEAASRPLSRTFEETVGRSLPSEFLKAGQLAGSDRGTSAFDRARAIATEGYANSLKDLAAEMGFQTYDAERNRQQEAVGLSQADTDLMIKNYEAQLMPTFIAQYGVDAGLKEYQTRVEAALDILRTAASVTQPTIGQKSTGTATSTSNSSSTNGIIPGLGSILSINR